MDFGGEAFIIFNKIFRGEQGKITLSRNYSGVNPSSLGVGPYFYFFGGCNFMEFFKGYYEEKGSCQLRGYGYYM